MRKFKIIALIVAGMLAIAPAASAHGGGGFHGGGFHSGGATAVIATLSEVTTAGTAVVADITGMEDVGMVGVTTVADIGMEARIGGGVTHSVPGTMTTVTNRIGPTTWMARRLTR